MFVPYTSENVVICPLQLYIRKEVWGSSLHQKNYCIHHPYMYMNEATHPLSLQTLFYYFYFHPSEINILANNPLQKNLILVKRGTLGDC